MDRGPIWPSALRPAGKPATDGGGRSLHASLPSPHCCGKREGARASGMAWHCWIWCPSPVAPILGIPVLQDVGAPHPRVGKSPAKKTMDLMPAWQSQNTDTKE